MAVHRLDDEKYKYLQFEPSIWKGIDTSDIGSILGNMFPKITRVTSLCENEDLSWFYGGVGVLGGGSVHVLYPYTEQHNTEESFLIQNVCFSVFPYILLKAFPREGWKFKEWMSATNKECLGTQEDFVIYETDFLEVTSFVAVFEEDASNVGI